MSEKFYNLLPACQKMQRELCVMASESLPEDILGVRFEKNKCYPEFYSCITKKWELYNFPIEALTEWRWHRVCANELFEFYLQYLAEKNKKYR